MSLRDYLFHEESGITLYCGDCREVLPLLEPESAGLVLADPPYNVGKDYGTHDDDMGAAEYQSWLVEVLTGCATVATDPVVFFPGTRNVWAVAEVLDKTPLRPHRMLGWHRREFAGDKWTGGPAMSWEPIIWATKVTTPAFNRIFGTIGRDFLAVDSTHGDPLAALHPCPKPLRVVRWLIGLFAPSAGLVVDPTSGTGTALLAAKESGHRAIGIEIEPKYCEIAVKRLRQEVLPL